MASQLQTPTATGAATPNPQMGPPPTPAAPSAPAAPTASTVQTPTPTPLPNLATDPAFLALARSVGLSQADAQAAAQQATAQVGARLSNTLAQQNVTNQEALTRQAGGYENRGVLNSGEALRGIAQSREAQGFREEALRQTAANQLAGIMTSLALQNQGGDVRLAEGGLSAAPTVFANANPA